MSEFKEGDIVKLKSGGPKMTIERIANYMHKGRKAQCNWFINNKKQSGLFALEVLEKA